MSILYRDDYPVDQLPNNYLTIPPTPQMVESIRRFGNIQPIVLSGNRLVCGRRRVDAARQAGLSTVRAMIFPAGMKDQEVIALVENTQRRSNPVNELFQVESLLNKGVSEEEIRLETGMSKQTFDKLLLIRDKLIRPLRRALEDKIIGIGTAEACAKKSVVVQNQLLDILEEDGRLTKKTVDEVCRVTRTASVASLPAEIFGGNDLSKQVRLQELLTEAKEIACQLKNQNLVDLLDKAMN